MTLNFLDVSVGGIIVRLFFGSVLVVTVAAGISAQVADGAASKKVDEFLGQWDKRDSAGCGVGVVRDGQLVYKRAFGMANLDFDAANTTQTKFNLASVSKAFTAFSILLLAEQGKLSLDDDIRKHLPEMPVYGEAITIRHLLSHTSGIREFEALVLFGGIPTDGSITDKAVMKMLTRQKNTSFKPGEKYQYSNSNFHLLGNIVARVSGKSLRVFADENIFKPLGMKNTQYFDNRQEIVKHRATGYIVGPGNQIKARASLYDLVGGGGLLSSVEDLYLWEQNFHEPKVGTREMMKTMTTSGVLRNGESARYGFGLFHGRYKGLNVIRHSGNMSGYRAQIVSFPEQKFSVIALCNNSAIFPSAIAEKLADIYLEGQFKPDTAIQKSVTEGLPPTVAISEKDAMRYAGAYANLESGNVFRLILKNGKLINNEFFKKEVEVKAVSADRLLVVEGNGVTELLPVYNRDGTVSEIKILDKNGKPDVYRPMKPGADSPEKLAEFAGTYYSDEFDANHRISVKGPGLVINIGENFESPPLTAWYADLFSGAGGQLKLNFTRDDKGRITGFVFNSAIDDREVKGVVFTRR